ncbi:hypothetical protein Ddc_05487 [Ditylenchus destructor]|nr:hypothetical protein Ddc_05487 [Ditylenchus destructor]
MGGGSITNNNNTKKVGRRNPSSTTQRCGGRQARADISNSSRGEGRERGDPGRRAKQAGVGVSAPQQYWLTPKQMGMD